MRMATEENCGFIPHRNVNDLRTDLYDCKKPKSTDAVFAQIVLFYDQNLQFEKKTFQKLEISNDTWFYYSLMILSVYPRAQR